MVSKESRLGGLDRGWNAYDDTSISDIMYLFLAAANRDPARWPDAHKFDVRREFKAHLGQPHLGFAIGPHICLGAPLARLEAKVALETLLRLAPEYELREVDYGTWGGGAFGPQSAIIDVGVASAA